eukprot:COSAG05_NODE_1188_length_5580_cov_3.406495_2_plen_86_part_00
MRYAGVVESVLNGIALLFVVAFDEKLFTLMVNKDHAITFTHEMAKCKNRDTVFAYALRQKHPSHLPRKRLSFPLYNRGGMPVLEV